ncbi:MAG: hypothetical protein ACI30I_11145 [Parabacteroides sp.]
MEAIIHILLVFISFSFLLKISLGSYRQIVGSALLCAAFVWLMWSTAAGQSRTQIADFLASPQQMQDVAVGITLEVVMLIAYCFDGFAAYRRHDNRAKRLISTLLRLYPGLLIGGVLFYLLTQTIYAFPGVGFRQIAAGVAGTTLVTVPALALLLRFGLPDRGLRLELLFLTNLFILALGVIATET